MDGAQMCVATCYLFLQQKRSGKKTRGGARMLRCACERVRSTRGRARVRCYADGGGVGARAVSGYRAKRAIEIDE